MKHLGFDIPGKQDVEIPEAEESVLFDVAFNDHLDKKSVEGEDPQMSAHRALFDFAKAVVKNHKNCNRVGQTHQEEL